MVDRRAPAHSPRCTDRPRLRPHQRTPPPIPHVYRLSNQGIFCIEAGLSLCTGLSITGIQDWSELLADKPLILSLPGVLAGLLLCVVGRMASGEAGAYPRACLIVKLQYCPHSTRSARLPAAPTHNPRSLRLSAPRIGRPRRLFTTHVTSRHVTSRHLTPRQRFRRP